MTLGRKREFFVMDMTANIGLGWTDERIAILKKLWLEGLSASQIAKQLEGLTRDAVIGKVHRLGLSGRHAPSMPSRPVFKAPRAPRIVVSASAPVHRDSKQPVLKCGQPLPERFEETGSATILTLGAHMCKWPIGDPATDGFSFCGKRSREDGPYCREHAQLAYQPQPKRAQRDGDVDLARSLRRYI